MNEKDHKQNQPFDRVVPILEEAFSSFVIVGSVVPEAPPVTYVRGDIFQCANICFYISSMIPTGKSPMHGTPVEKAICDRVHSVIHTNVDEMVIGGFPLGSNVGVPSYAYYGNKENCTLIIHALGRELKLLSERPRE
jgi:hypothetical protein